MNVFHPFSCSFCSWSQQLSVFRCVTLRPLAHRHVYVCFPKYTRQQKHNKTYFYMAVRGMDVTDTHTKTTHCHVFDIHVSLPLQLGYYLPVEPLKLQVRRSREQREREEGTLVIIHLMGGWSATVCQLCSQRQTGKILQVSKREMESDHLSVCVCAGVRAKSEVALMNESETKRGNAHRFSPFLSGSLITVRVSECFHRHSLAAMWQRVPTWGGTDELEDPITEGTQMTAVTLSHTRHTPSSKSVKGFLPWFSLTWFDAVTHQLESINKSTHSLMLLATTSQRSASQLSCPKVQR